MSQSDSLSLLPLVPVCQVAVILLCCCHLPAQSVPQEAAASTNSAWQTNSQTAAKEEILKALTNAAEAGATQSELKALARAEALKALMKLAEAGDTKLQLDLAMDYETGLPWLPRDTNAAFRWCRKAAESGDSRGELMLAQFYQAGVGVECDLTQAFEWFRKSAEQGNVVAEMNLGMAYSGGKGVQTNVTEAQKWYRKAADSGDPFPEFMFGLFNSAQDDPADQERAVTWLRKAADQGECDAQFILGTCYQLGRGVEKDLVEAYKWETLGARAGGWPGTKVSSDLLKEIGPSQMMEGLNRANAFEPHRSDVKIPDMPQRLPVPGESQSLPR